MDTLADIDRAIFQEQVLIEKEEIEARRSAMAAGKAARDHRPEPLVEEDLQASLGDEEVLARVSLAGAAHVATAATRLWAPVLTPKTTLAMSIRRSAARRDSRSVCATFAEAFAAMAGAEAPTGQDRTAGIEQAVDENV